MMTMLLLLLLMMMIFKSPLLFGDGLA